MEELLFPFDCTKIACFLNPTSPQTITVVNWKARMRKHRQQLPYKYLSILGNEEREVQLALSRNQN